MYYFYNDVVLLGFRFIREQFFVGEKPGMLNFFNVSSNFLLNVVKKLRKKPLLGLFSTNMFSTCIMYFLRAQNKIRAQKYIKLSKYFSVILLVSFKKVFQINNVSSL